LTGRAAFQEHRRLGQGDFRRILDEDMDMIGHYLYFMDEPIIDLATLEK